MFDAFIGVGSNIEPVKHIRLACSTLSKIFGELSCSSVYRSPAFGFDGDDFLNMVVGIRSAVSPVEIDDRLSSVEHAGGRHRSGAQFCSRTLDLDLLLCGSVVDARLRLPRDDILHYPFVLAPLAEMAPALIHPVNGCSMLGMWTVMQRARPVLTKLDRSDCLGGALPADAAATVDR